MFSQSTPPLIIAHRGDCLHAPENTLAAFEMAVYQGADGIELDAMLCADGKVVVIHDQTVDRTTTGSGFVAEMTLEDLKKLDAGSHFDISFKGEKIPILDEVFESFGSRTMINLELKNYSSIFDSLPDKVAKIASKHNLAHKVLFSSFNPIALRKIRRLLPQALIGLLTMPGNKGIILHGWVGRFLVPYQSLHPEANNVNPHFLNNIRQGGKLLYAYNVNHSTEIQHLFTMGIDGIITDDILLAKQLKQALFDEFTRE